MKFCIEIFNGEVCSDEEIIEDNMSNFGFKTRFYENKNGEDIILLIGKRKKLKKYVKDYADDYVADYDSFGSSVADIVKEFNENNYNFREIVKDE